MADLLVRDIPESTKQGLVDRAEKAGHSVSDEVKAILQREFQSIEKTSGDREVSAWEALRSIMVADSEEEAEEYGRIMDKIEAERKLDFGRPAEHLE